MVWRWLMERLQGAEIEQLRTRCDEQYETIGRLSGTIRDLNFRAFALEGLARRQRQRIATLEAEIELMDGLIEEVHGD